MRDPRHVTGYLGRLRARAGLVHAARALSLALGAASLGFVAAAFAVGPVVSWPLAILSHVAILLVAAATVIPSVRAIASLRGARAARLLSSVRDDLASAARSAVELAQDRHALAASPDLVKAHARAVSEALARVPTARVVPLRDLRHPSLLAGLLACGVAVAIGIASDRVAAGAFALLHPAARDAEGDRVAAVVSRLDVRLVYPTYLRRPELSLSQPSAIEAPRGTSLSITVVPRIATQGGTLSLGEREVRLVPERDGTLRGELVIREDGELFVRLRDADGVVLRDPGRRSVRAIPDEAPRAVITEPASDVLLDPDEELGVAWDATDDVALRGVALVFRLPSGREVRRRVAELADDEPRLVASGGERIAISELELEPGDSATMWIEATDGDVVSGPNVGVSERRTITVASESTRRAMEIAELHAVIDMGLDALADRLEIPVTNDGDAARTRFEHTRVSTDAFADTVDRLAEESEGRDGVPRDLANRLRAAAAAEARLFQGAIAGMARRAPADARIVDEIEKDVLLLTDLLGRARLDDAASIARELESIRREMTSLLAELRRASTPEAREALLRAIGRAEARMAELSARLAAMSADVPGEFLNQGDVPTEETQDALAAMRDAITRGDLDAAERQLLELQRRIDSIARALGGADEAFGEARFGPRERALAEALDALTGLEAEQEQLARRTAEVQRNAAEHALEALGEGGRVASRLEGRAREIRSSLDRVRTDDLGAIERETYDRARQRLTDIGDALSSGDLGEARRMSEQADSDLGDLSRDLDLSSLMFGGPEGQTAEGARAAREASRDMAELRRAIDEAIPQLDDYVDDAARRTMREDAPRQGRAVSAADQLASHLEEAPDGSPLSPEGAEATRAAREAMERGRRSLERGDAMEAALAQGDAARRLTELREKLERDQEQQSNGGGSGGQNGRELDFSQPVHIPDADEFEGPMERRRRLLDAMREQAPNGYEDSVRAYYEELLR